MAEQQRSKAWGEKNIARDGKTLAQNGSSVAGWRLQQCKMGWQQAELYAPSPAGIVAAYRDDGKATRLHDMAVRCASFSSLGGMVTQRTYHGYGATVLLEVMFTVSSLLFFYFREYGGFLWAHGWGWAIGLWCAANQSVRESASKSAC